MSNKANKARCRIVKHKILTQHILSEFEEIAKNRYIPKPTGQVYWVADWSLIPMCDGYEAHQMDISFRFKGKHCLFFASKNWYRIYYPWQIWETEGQARHIADMLNSLTSGYNFKAYDAFIDKIGGYHTVPEDCT